MLLSGDVLSVSSLLDKILGRPLKSSERAKQELSVVTGVPVLGLDALSSVAYGPEAALTILVPVGAIGLRCMPMLTVAILVLLTILYVSYRQTIAAYPNGGGAYIVAKENLGARAGLVAGAALLLDYMLNVAVGISAGVAALVSAVPALHHHQLSICLAVLAILTFINLRGVRESGLIFTLPTFAFVGCVGVAIIIGLIRAWQSGGHPEPVEPLPKLPKATEAVTAWLLLRAFASGCTAMTGVEAVSNGVPLFAKPTVRNAHWTLTVIVAVLGVLLLGLAWLCPAYHIGAMDQQKPGYQTILSQLVVATTGRGVFYYVAIASILIILTFSANTSFADFPRVCRLLAEDEYLPPSFANRGRRLVFTQGIGILAIISGLILIGFGGVTERLIPLFAVGAFSAFTLSQAGMVGHWRRKRGKGAHTSMVINGAGAVCTGVALAIIIVAKFIEGAWVTLIIVPGVVVLFQRIHQHYQKITKEIGQPVELKTAKVQPPVVIIPIDGWNRVAERALRFGMEMSDDIIALHVTADKDGDEYLREVWAEQVEKPAKAAKVSVPRLEIIFSPYRQIYDPILDFVKETRKAKSDRLIAVIIPDLVEPHWYEWLLHNHHGLGLRAFLLRERDPRIVVITTPWYLREK
jgi:amino acid transporter